MDLDAYVAEHAGEWARLERLARRRKLSPGEVDELFALYQRTGTHLSMVRSHAPDPALIARLSRIVLTARATITGGPTFSGKVVREFFASSLPLALFQAWRWWSAVATLGTAFAFGLIWWVAGSHDVQLRFMTQDQIDSLVGHDFADYYSANQPQNFALEVWTHNALLTGEVLAGGILLLPVFYLLYQNLLSIGVLGGVMIGNGRGPEFFGLIMPHGMLELTTVYVACGLGLRIGWAWIAPGPRRSRGQALGEAARSAVLGAVGLALVLGVSGLVEAFVTPSALPTPVRVGIGLALWLGFLGYIVFFGGRAAQLSKSADLDESLSEAPVPVA